MAGSIAVDKMTDAALWKLLQCELSWLAGAQLGQMGIAERRGRAVICEGIVRELHTRGMQLTLPTGDSRSRSHAAIRW
jgi:hypothetical protein